LDASEIGLGFGPGTVQTAALLSVGDGESVRSGLHDCGVSGQEEHSRRAAVAQFDGDRGAYQGALSGTQEDEGAVFAFLDDGRKALTRVAGLFLQRLSQTTMLGSKVEGRCDRA
jgi:hypothetical protein